MEVDEHGGAGELLAEVELAEVEEEVESETSIFFRGYRYALRDQHTT